MTCGAPASSFWYETKAFGVGHTYWTYTRCVSHCRQTQICKQSFQRPPSPDIASANPPSVSGLAQKPEERMIDRFPHPVMYRPCTLRSLPPTDRVEGNLSAMIRYDAAVPCAHTLQRKLRAVMPRSSMYSRFSFRAFFCAISSRPTARCFVFRRHIYLCVSRTFWPATAKSTRYCCTTSSCTSLCSRKGCQAQIAGRQGAPA